MGEWLCQQVLEWRVLILFFSVKYNLKIYTENSFELMHSQQADKNEKSLEVKFKSMTAIESFKIS